MPKKRTRTTKRTVKRTSKRRVAQKKRHGVQKKSKRAELPARVSAFLKKTSAKVEPLGHRTVFTAYDMAQTLKVDLSSVAKTLVLQGGGDTIVAVVPASHNLDIKALTKTVNAHRTRHGKKPSGKLQFASERVIKSRLKVIPGAVPPFGLMLGIETFVDKRLTKPRTLVVSGGNFESALSMTPAELLRLSEAILGSFSVQR